MDLRRAARIWQRRSNSDSHCIDQSELAAVPEHADDPRVRGTPIPQRSELPLHRSEQGFRAQSGGLDESRAGNLGRSRAVSWRFPVRAPAYRTDECRPHLPGARKDVAASPGGVLQHLQPDVPGEPVADGPDAAAEPEFGRTAEFRMGLYQYDVAIQPAAQRPTGSAFH